MQPKPKKGDDRLGPTLAECGKAYKLNDKYTIELPGTEFIVLKAGGLIGHPAFNFTHPNVLRRKLQVCEFKHYMSGGHKRWTSHAGVTHYMAIPSTQVRLVLKAGYSYVEVDINGVRVAFNVSGGGGCDGWTDYVRAMVAIDVNHPQRELNKLAAVAYTPDAFRKETQGKCEPVGGVYTQWDSPTTFKQLAADRLGWNAFQGVGATPARVFLREGYCYSDLRLLEYHKGYMMCMSENTMKCRVKRHQVDWMRTLDTAGIVYLPDWVRQELVVMEAEHAADVARENQKQQQETVHGG